LINLFYIVENKIFIYLLIGYFHGTISSLRSYSSSKRNTMELFCTILDLSSSPDTMNLQHSGKHQHYWSGINSSHSQYDYSWCLALW